MGNNQKKKVKNKPTNQETVIKSFRKSTSDSEYLYDPSKLILDFVSTDYENKILSQHKMLEENLCNIDLDEKYNHCSKSCANSEDEETCECTNSTSLQNKINEKTISFEKQANIIRLKFYSSILKKGLWNHPMDKPINNIVIFDWDDTLMFSSEYHNYKINISNKESEIDDSISLKLNKSVKSYDSKNSNIIHENTKNIVDLNCKDKLHYSYDIFNFYKAKSINANNFEFYIPIIKELKSNFDIKLFNTYFNNKLPQLKILKKNVQKLISMCIKECDVFIVSNARLPWIYFTAVTFFPEFYQTILEKVKIISARDHFSNENDINLWKYYCFKRISRSYNRNLKTNLIIVGDSISEIEAGKEVKKEFKNIKLKTVKFKEKPSIEVMNKQLELLINHFPKILNKDDDSCIVVNNK